MEHRKQHLPLIAAGLLALAGCTAADADRTVAKKPDVTQLGVLPPPQEVMRPGSGVVPAGGIQPSATPAAPAPATAPAAAAVPSPASALAKLTTRPEKKIPASEMALAWRNNIEFLPDPARNGVPGPGLAGQLFLYGGPKLEFALADGTLTVDLIDETPRPAGQAPATPERWQFDKNMLRNLRTTDETFGKSYLLFLPWPAYRPDITKVKISARYDPDNGHTLFGKPATVTIGAAAPTFDLTANRTPIGPGGPPTPPVNQAPIPLGGGPLQAQPAPNSGLIPLGGSQRGAVPTTFLSPGTVTPMPSAPVGAMPAAPLPPAAYGAPPAPAGVMPVAPAVPEGAMPLITTIGRQ